MPQSLRLIVSPASYEESPDGRLADTENPCRAIQLGWRPCRSAHPPWSRSNKQHSLQPRCPFLHPDQSTNGRRLHKSSLWGHLRKTLQFDRHIGDLAFHSPHPATLFLCKLLRYV